MKIPFTKAHGARNDFLLTWSHEAPADGLNRLAEAICDRNTGIGADGWLLVGRAQGGASGSIRLFNCDGGEVEISGNGTRCAAAFLVEEGASAGDLIIATGAGPKHLRPISRHGHEHWFEMNMGPARIPEGCLRYTLNAAGQDWDVTILDVGNPQCAVIVSDFDFDWKSAGRAIETHPLFPKRSNVSFVRKLDDVTIDVRFFERGVGFTFSSGTGSTGAAAAAAARGLVRRGTAASPVTVRTLAGPLELRWEETGGEHADIHLTGPAEITARGHFYFG